MTPKEKAEELVDKFLYIENEYKEYLDFKQAKECALIAVDEIIFILAEDINPLVNYWFKVKLEIENL
jgi:hypothetical protein